MKYIEVEPDDRDSLEIFKKFYKEVLESSFDEDELETYEQLLDTLKKSKRGENGLNSYHIMIVLEEDILLGGVIYDYFIDTNTGIIEYIATNQKVKQKGVASYAFEVVNGLLNKEAKRNGFGEISYITGEVEQVISEKKSNHYFWEKFGFKALDFHYIQPPLDEDKEVVDIMNFGIITKAPLTSYDKEDINKEELKSILHDYYHYTMRIEDVEHCEYYIKMCHEIDNKEKIKLISV